LIKNTQDRANDNLVFTGKAVKQGCQTEEINPYLSRSGSALSSSPEFTVKKILLGEIIGACKG
jgi:hypothetical protein